MELMLNSMVKISKDKSETEKCRECTNQVKTRPKTGGNQYKRQEVIPFPNMREEVPHVGFNRSETSSTNNNENT
jgi:hypothetical protein